MGNGSAIIPTDTNIYAPVSGTITVAYETKHAYGIKSDDGAEVLIHLGIDTVNLKGQYFDSQVLQGQHVNEGELLGHFDIEKIKMAGYETTVIVAITNTGNFSMVEPIDTKIVQHGDQLVAVTA